VAFGDDGGKSVTVGTLVKQVKAKRLPEVDDEWVSEVTEFETVAEMRSELTRQMEEIRVRSARTRLGDQAVSDLVNDLDLDLPEALVQAEMDAILHRFAHRLESRGIPFDQYLALSGQDRDAFTADLRSQAEMNLRTRILLDAVAETEGIEVTAGELEDTITALAAGSRTPLDEYRKALVEGGQEETLAGDILRRKAVDRIAELVSPVDGDGNAIELPEIEVRAPAALDEVGEGEGFGLAPEDEGADDEHGHEPAEVEE
jgi:trigger factor